MTDVEAKTQADVNDAVDTRITSIEDTLRELKFIIKHMADTQTTNTESIGILVEWAKNIRGGSHLLMGFFGWLGRMVMLVAKVGGSAIIVWGIIHALLTGRAPTLNSIEMPK